MTESKDTAVLYDHQRLQVASATVGTPYFLNTPEVTEAPSRVNQPIPVPSVYTDERGDIHNFCVGGKRINLLYTKKGVMRSGDLHKSTQHDFVFTGKVRLWQLLNDGTTEKVEYQANEYIAIPPYVPHVFEFLEDTVVAEWWDDDNFFAWFYHPYRKLVDESFTATEPGAFSHYVVKSVKDKVDYIRPILLICTGIGIGLVAGARLGKGRNSHYR